MKQLINKTNIGKTILILCGVALVVFALRWKLYIDMLNSNSVNYEYSINCECMGTSAIGEDLMYIVTKKGETSFVSDFVVSSDTVVYRKRVYEYWDFPLLIGDYSCVDYEFHFVNVDTKEEEEIQPGLMLRVESNVLPENNEVLYHNFPALKNYIASDNYVLHIYYPRGYSYEDIAKMLIEDGRELTYEGVSVYDDYSKDGITHMVSSYEEYMRYWDEDKFFASHLYQSLWQYSHKNYSMWAEWQWF